MRGTLQWCSTCTYDPRKLGRHAEASVASGISISREHISVDSPLQPPCICRVPLSEAIQRRTSEAPLKGSTACLCSSTSRGQLLPAPSSRPWTRAFGEPGSHGTKALKQEKRKCVSGKLLFHSVIVANVYSSRSLMRCICALLEHLG